MKISALAFLAFFNLAALITADTRRHERDGVTGHIPSTHEEVLSQRYRRKELFGDRLAEMTKKMEDHTSGAQLLTQMEFNRLERKMKAYETKVEELNGEFDQRHLNRVLTREELLNEMTRSRFARREEL